MKKCVITGILVGVAITLIITSKRLKYLIDSGRDTKVDWQVFIISISIGVVMLMATEYIGSIVETIK